MRRLGKAVSGKPDRGFESLTLRNLVVRTSETKMLTNSVYTNKTLILRVLIVLLIFLSLSIYVSEKLKIEYTQPFINDGESIRIETKPFEILEGPLSLNIGLLKYKTTILNNVVSTIEGDKEDYPHEVQLFIKYGKEDINKLEVPFNVETYIFENKSLTRADTILRLKNINYLPNINLNPDLLANSRYIGLNKSTHGNITIKSVLDFKSKIILYFSVLILIGLIFQAIQSILQFILWRY